MLTRRSSGPVTPSAPSPDPTSLTPRSRVCPRSSSRSRPKSRSRSRSQGREPGLEGEQQDRTEEEEGCQTPRRGRRPSASHSLLAALTSALPDSSPVVGNGDSLSNSLNSSYTNYCSIKTPKTPKTPRSVLVSSAFATPSRGFKERRLPPQFRPMLPTSARKKPEEDAKSRSFLDLPSISGGSFYGGGGGSKYATKLESLSKSAGSSPLATKNEMLQKPSSGKCKKSLGKRGLRNNKNKRVLSLGGMNKGVSHSIKRPKRKVVVEKENSKKTNNNKDSTPSSKSNKKLFQVEKHGGVGALTPSVGYVVINGQLQFVRRRSPRKKQQQSREEQEDCHLTNLAKTPVNRKTPKLFTPSSQGDFLTPGSTDNSPARPGGKKFIPSPVKFSKHADDNDDDENDHHSMAVDNIIDNLESLKTPVKENRYAVYVENGEQEELSRAAWDAARELQDLQDFNLGQDSPLMLPVSEPELAMSSPSTNKEKDESENSARRGLFPVFRKGAKTGISSPSSKRATRSNSNSPYKRVGGPQDNSKTIRAARDGMRQLVIDAGQSRVRGRDVEQCGQCGFVYAAGDPEEEKMHTEHHHRFGGALDLRRGWKDERVVLADEARGLRILAVRPGDPARHWEKAKAVLQVADDFLGFSTSSGGLLRRPDRSDAYLAVMEKRVVGCLLAEPVGDRDRLAWSYNDGGVRVLSDDLAVRNRDRLAGVSRLWVHRDFQRRGLATALVEALRRQHSKPHVLAKSNIALSHTSEMGALFATSYFGTDKFLVYKPELLN